MTGRKLKDTFWESYKEVLRERLVERLGLEGEDLERFNDYFNRKGEKVFRTIVEIAILILENKLNNMQGLYVKADICPFNVSVLFDKILEGE